MKNNSIRHFEKEESENIRALSLTATFVLICANVLIEMIQCDLPGEHIRLCILLGGAMLLSVVSIYLIFRYKQDNAGIFIFISITLILFAIFCWDGSVHDSALKLNTQSGGITAQTNNACNNVVMLEDGIRV